MSNNYNIKSKLKIIDESGNLTIELPYSDNPLLKKTMIAFNVLFILFVIYILTQILSNGFILSYLFAVLFLLAIYSNVKILVGVYGKEYLDFKGDLIIVRNELYGLTFKKMIHNKKITSIKIIQIDNQYGGALLKSDIKIEIKRKFRKRILIGKWIENEDAVKILDIMNKQGTPAETHN